MFIRGVELNESNFAGLLYQIAEQGDSTARSDFADALGEALASGDPLRAPIVELLESFLVSGPPKQADFAVCIHHLHEVLSPTRFFEALERTDLSIPGLRPTIAYHAYVSIWRGTVPYSRSLRRFGGDRSLDGWLTPCFVAFDHAWFLEHVRLVLGDDPDKADGWLGASLSGLTKAEVLRLRDELHERRAQVGDETLRLFEERLAEVIPRGDFEGTPNTIRWAPTDMAT